MENCIFCQIISNKIDCYTIFEDNNFKVILDKFPASFGHCLIISKTHAKNIFEINENITKNIFHVVEKISKILKSSLNNMKGLNLLQNNGPIAGQTVDHFHIHIIPRYENDNISISWNNLNLQKKDFLKILNNMKKFIK